MFIFSLPDIHKMANQRLDVVIFGATGFSKQFSSLLLFKFVYSSEIPFLQILSYIV